MHYRKDTECVDCPSNAILLVLLFILLVFVAGACAAWMHRKMFNLKGAREHVVCLVRSPVRVFVA